MKKQYQRSEMQVVELKQNNVVSTSGAGAPSAIRQGYGDATTYEWD